MTKDGLPAGEANAGATPGAAGRRRSLARSIVSLLLAPGRRMGRWFERLPIGAKLTLGFSAMIVLLVASSIVLFVNAYHSESLIDDLAREGKQNGAAKQVAAEFSSARMMVWRALASAQTMYWDDSGNRLTATIGELHRLTDATRDQDRKAKGVEISAELDAFVVAVKALRAYNTYDAAKNDPAGAKVLAGVSWASDQITRDLADLARPYGDAADTAQDLVKSATSFAMNLSLGFALGGAALALLLAFAIVRAIRRPIADVTLAAGALAQGDLTILVPHADERNEMGELARAVEVFKTNAIERQALEAEAQGNRAATEAERGRAAADKARAAETQAAAMRSLGGALTQLAEGDLTVRLDAGFPTEFAKIRDDFNHAADRLMQVVRAVVEDAVAIRSGANEITIASEDLSKRTGQQAASLEETAAAVDGITATLKNSAEGARRASKVVASADSEANRGAIVVKQAVEAMDAIAKSSQQIGQIIGVIDEIAFQTNLLALNAGVEAARAGDAGRGFAVVASEVRALAQRSAEAAREIKSLISASGAAVGSGVKLVAETGAALERILAQVSEINRDVADIASGVHEQATGLGAVNEAINEMDRSTQKNAAMAEQSTAASLGLFQQAEQLGALVDQFRLPGEPDAAPTRAVDPSKDRRARRIA